MTLLEVIKAHLPSTARGTFIRKAGDAGIRRYCECGVAVEVRYSEIPANAIDIDDFDLEALLSHRMAEHVAEQIKEVLDE